MNANISTWRNSKVTQILPQKTLIKIFNWKNNVWNTRQNSLKKATRKKKKNDQSILWSNSNTIFIGTAFGGLNFCSWEQKRPVNIFHSALCLSTESALIFTVCEFPQRGFGHHVVPAHSTRPHWAQNWIKDTRYSLAFSWEWQLSGKSGRRGKGVG